ncbi:MAG: lamin tail domain-containing protein [Planctomycetota bacterium]
MLHRRHLPVAPVALLAFLVPLVLYTGMVCAQDRSLVTSQPAATTGVVLNEIVASNQNGLRDEDGDSSDWIELSNTGGRAIDLDGWYLTDDPNELTKWKLPRLRIGSNQYAVVFASGKARDELIFWSTIIDWGEDFRYLVPTSQPPSNWHSLGFDDSGWSLGPSGFGFGDGDDATYLEAQTIYVRHEFDLAAGELTDLLQICLHVDFDDGIVAYLNGEEVARFNMGDPGTVPRWNDYADAAHEAELYAGGGNRSSSPSTRWRARSSGAGTCSPSRFTTFPCFPRT